MVPRPVWGINLRRRLPKSRWNKIRQGLIAERGLKCQTCGKVETESNHIFVHEEWEYETARSPATARLSGLKLSCWHCHAVEHFGATVNMVHASRELTDRAIEDTIEHFCRLNSVGRNEFHAHLAEAKAEWSRLNRLDWTINWGSFDALITETGQKRQQRRDRLEERAEESEDLSLYQWPYLHSGEAM